MNLDTEISITLIEIHLKRAEHELNRIMKEINAIGS